MKRNNPFSGFVAPIMVMMTVLTMQARAQRSIDASTLTQTLKQGERQWVASKREKGLTEWMKYHFTTNAVTGKVKIVTNSYVALGVGINVQDEQGRFKAADPSFVITEEGVAATGTAHKLQLSSDIGTDGAVKIQQSDGAVIRSHPLGLGYFDPVSGDSVVIANLTNAVGWLVRSNVVVYSNCFHGISASILYRNKQSGMQQDVVFHERPPSPEEYGLSPLSQLEVFTEFLPGSHLPVKERQTIYEEKDASKRAVMNDPDIIDTSIDFGAMKMGRGTAFFLDSRSTSNGITEVMSSSMAPVFKLYEPFGDAHVLIEAIEHRHLKQSFEKLPPIKDPQASTGSQIEANTTNQVNLLNRGIPSRLLGDLTEASIQLAQVNVVSPYWLAAGASAVIIDYELIGTETLTDQVFRGDTTYFIDGEVTCNGTTTFEAGTVLKYDNGSELALNGPAEFKTSQYLPAIITAKDEDSVGEIIQGSTGVVSSHYAGIGLFFLSQTDSIIKHVRISHAVNGIVFWNYTGSEDNLIRHCQFVHCREAIYAFGSCDLTLRNVLFSDVEDNAVTYTDGNYDVVTAEHITLHGANRFAAVLNGTTANVNIYNSLVIGSTMDVATDYSLDAASQWLPESEAPNVFASHTDGHHYINDVTGLSYRNLNNASAIADPTFLEELQTMTTMGPSFRSGPQSFDLTIAPDDVYPDNDGLLDLGYHYPLIDTVVTKVDMNTHSLSFGGGVVVAVQFQDSTSNYGIRIGGGDVTANGDPLAPVVFTELAAIQESPTASGHANRPFFTEDVNGGTSDLVWFQNSHFNRLGRTSPESDHFEWGRRMDRFVLKNCSFRNGYLYVGCYDVQDRIFALTNNMFLNTDFVLIANQPILFYCYNSLFLKGKVSITTWPNSGNVSWQLFDNIFDHNEYVTDNGRPIGNGHNAYVGFNGVLPINGSPGQNLYLDTLTYEPGPLGDYYLPQVLSGSTQLKDAGSRYADAAGLFHYTTATTNEKEESSGVDVGPHYVALDGQGLPIDSDADTIPDYVEDSNGNGLTDGVEESFSNPWLVINTDSLEYVSGNPPMIIDATASAEDIDSFPSLDFLAGGVLNVAISNGAEDGDAVGIRHEGGGSEEIGIQGNSIEYEGISFATYNRSGGGLTVTFGAGSTKSAVVPKVRPLGASNKLWWRGVRRLYSIRGGGSRF